MNDIIVKNVDVMGDMVTAAKDIDGNIWVGVKYICDALEMSEGQVKRQIKNIHNDMVFQGGSNQIPLPTNRGSQTVFCIRNDFIPLWLARINITEKTRKERPEFAAKLLDYQLKAKDILAEAFYPKQTLPTTTEGKIQLLAQGNVELNKKVDTLTERIDKLEMDLPLFPSEAEEVSNAAKRRGVEVLGGKRSAAYRNKSIRAKVYRTLYLYLNYNFGTRRYKEIKRGMMDKAVEIAETWTPPEFLAREIAGENSQN